MSTSKEALKVITQITDHDNFVKWSGCVIALYEVRSQIDQLIAGYNELIATTDAHKNLNKIKTTKLIGDNNGKS